MSIEEEHFADGMSSKSQRIFSALVVTPELASPPSRKFAILHRTIFWTFVYVVQPLLPSTAYPSVFATGDAQS